MNYLKAEDIMTQDVLTVRADWSLDRLSEFLVGNSISGAPVVSGEEKLIGVVSLTDIVLHGTLSVKDPPPNEPHEYYVNELERQYGQNEIKAFRISGEPLTTVRDIMTPVIFKVTEDATVQQVANTMINSRVHRVFVTREDELVGIIATPDMLKVIRDSFP
ncbi:MAG TPA: hypothetical protein DDW42_04535 [Desulfobacteraceae bacterium]|nr:hypothetical protein [Desulfobacteraceae bacterium]